MNAMPDAKVFEAANTPSAASRSTRLITGARAAVARDLAEGQIDALHATGDDAVMRVLPVLGLDGTIWECACGDGAIVRVLEAAGLTVIASDIADHGFGETGVDFLKAKRARARTILTNPPFAKQGGERFARHALNLLARLPADRARPRRLILLHRARWLETPPRDDLFETPAFRRWLPFNARTAMMHRAGYRGKKLKLSPEWYAWYEWNLDHPRRPGEAWQGVRL